MGLGVGMSSGAGVRTAAVSSVAPSIRDQINEAPGAGTGDIALDTTGIGWASGDYTLASFVTGAVILGASGTTDDTYASLDTFLGGTFDAELFQGTIVGGAFDTVTNFDADSTTRRGCAACINVQDTSGIDVESAGEGGTSTTPTSGDVTTTVANCLVFSLFWCGGAHAIAGLIQPSGWTKVYAISTTPGGGSPTASNQKTMGLAWKVQASAGATGAGAWSGLEASVSWAAKTIAFAP